MTIARFDHLNLMSWVNLNEMVTHAGGPDFPPYAVRTWADRAWEIGRIIRENGIHCLIPECRVIDRSSGATRVADHYGSDIIIVVSRTGFPVAVAYLYRTGMTIDREIAQVAPRIPGYGGRWYVGRT